MTKSVRTFEQWVADLQHQSQLHEAGEPWEHLLENLIMFARASDPTLPEFVMAGYRRQTSSGQLVIHAWGEEDDPTVGEDTLRRIRIHLVSFVDSNLHDVLDTECVTKAVRQAILFYEQAAKTNMYRDIASTDPAAGAAEFIYRNSRNVSAVKVHVISDLPSEEDFAENLDPFDFNLEPTSVECAVWSGSKLYNSAMAIDGADTSDVNLDLSQTDENGITYGHPVTAVGEEQGWEVYVTAFTGRQLVKFYEEHRLRLVNENVRAFLQFSGKTNKGIKNTIMEEPTRFISYNNGISVVAKRVLRETTEGGSDVVFTIEGAQIVNGGQTTAALFHASQDPAAQPMIDLVRIFAKITVLPDDEDMRDQAIAKIARYANTQNTIKPSDLESNWAYFRDLSQAAEVCPVPEGNIGAGTIWTFDRARGRYEEQRRLRGGDWELLHPLNQVIDKTILADVMNCVSGRPHESQRGGEGLIRHYLVWLKSRNFIDGRFSDQTIRGLTFFGDNRNHSRDEHDDFVEEWRGVVSSVLIRRVLEQEFQDTEGWMRTIKIRYVLALAYLAAEDSWLDVWDSQEAESIAKNSTDSAGVNRIGQLGGLAAWAQIAGALVEEKITKQSKETQKAVNDIAKTSNAWQVVLQAAKKKDVV